MGFEKFLFYIFALTTLGAAGMTITRRNPVHAVLWLVMAFVSSAALWLLLEAEFLGIVLVLVYVGAVMVLFLFVVMMLDVDIATLRAGFIRYAPLGALIALLMAIQILFIVGPGNFGLDAFPAPAAASAEVANTELLGMMLFTDYVYPFEIAAVILLVAIVAAIRLTLRRRPGNKYMDPALQVRVRKGIDRVRLVDVSPDGLMIYPASPKQEQSK